MTQDIYKKAHVHCTRNRDMLEADTECGCFHCLRVYDPAQIQKWIDNGQTALCPHCGVDSVLGKGAGYPLTDAFLKGMHVRWFGEEL